MRGITFLLLLLLVLCPVFSQSGAISLVQSTTWVLIFSFLTVFGIIYLSLHYFLERRGQSNRNLELLMSVSIAGLSTIFLANNPVILEFVKGFYIIFTFLGPISLIIAGFRTIENKKLKILLGVIFVLCIIYLIFFTGILDFANPITSGGATASDLIVRIITIVAIIAILIFIILMIIKLSGATPSLRIRRRRKKEKKKEKDKSLIVPGQTITTSQPDLALRPSQQAQEDSSITDSGIPSEEDIVPAEDIPDAGTVAGLAELLRLLREGGE